MLTKETIEALLEIDTQNKKDNRALRIMSCDNPIKELYVYELNNIKEEFRENPMGFEEQLELCIRKFNKELALYLEGKANNVNIKDSTTILTNELIGNAFTEMKGIYALLSKVVDESDFTSATLHDIVSYKLSNYIAILELCGLVDVSNDIYRSKLLSRVLNIKEQVRNYKDGRMASCILTTEFAEHLNYFLVQFDLIESNEMYNEDFLVYVIMFDIRHYKHNRKKQLII